MERTETAGGRRLRLAPLLPADAAAVASWYADDEFRRLVDARATPPLTVDDVLAEIAEDAADDRSFSYALRTVPADVLIGKASLHDIVWPRRAGWLSLALGPAWWGQGYGRRALALLLEEAFLHLGLAELFLTVYDDNPRALALYTRAGFRREGVLGRYRSAEGRPRAALLMGLRAEEWPQGGAR